MKTKYQDLESTIQQYVMGNMTEAQQEEFEEFYVLNPDVSEMVETAQQINVGLESAISESFETAVSSKNDTASLFENLKRLISIPIPAYAVALLVLGASPLLLNTVSTVRQSEEINLIAFSSQVTRGQEGLNIIQIPEGENPSAMFIKLPTVEYQYYQLELHDSKDNALIWVSEEFQPSSLRDKLVILPSSLAGGEYKASIFGLDVRGNKQLVEYCHYSESCN